MMIATGDHEVYIDEDVDDDNDEDDNYDDRKSDRNLCRLPTCAQTQGSKASSTSLSFLLLSSPEFPRGEKTCWSYDNDGITFLKEEGFSISVR